MENFEEFLFASFGEGITNRELRLSNRELEIVKRKFPKANIKPLDDEFDEGLAEKNWYEINLTPSSNEKTGAYQTETEIKNLQRENHLIKQELNELKKSLMMK